MTTSIIGSHLGLVPWTSLEGSYNMTTSVGSHLGLALGRRLEAATT